jgi:uncharacterized protein (TIGR02466 family)
MNLNIQNQEVITLFPSLLFKAELEDTAICDELERKLRTLKTLGKGTMEHKNFISHDMLQDDPDFAELAHLVLRETGSILDFYKVVRDDHYISNMWGNITNSNHRHMNHTHPNTFLSGILYIKTPDKCGFTAFNDPRPGARVLEPSYSEMNETNSGVFMFPPKKGTMLFWNSWLPHGVERGFNTEQEDRIVIAFNVMLRAKISLPTAKLELK